MPEPFTIPYGALQPVLEAQFLKKDGTPQDLTGATVVFSMEHAGSDVLEIDNAAAIVTNGLTGLVEFRWSGAQTQFPPGKHRGRFKVTAGLAGGLPVVWPSFRHLDITILEPIGT